MIFFEYCDEMFEEVILSRLVTGKRDLLHFNPIKAKALSLEQLQVNPVQPIECSFAACGFASCWSASQHFVFDCDAQLLLAVQNKSDQH